MTMRQTPKCNYKNEKMGKQKNKVGKRRRKNKERKKGVLTRRVQIDANQKICRVSTRNAEGRLGNGAHGRRAIAQPVAHGPRCRGARPQEGAVRVHRIRVDRGVMMRIWILTLIILVLMARMVCHRGRRREWPDVAADAAHLALPLQVPVEDRARNGRR